MEAFEDERESVFSRVLRVHSAKNNKTRRKTTIINSSEPITIRFRRYQTTTTTTTTTTIRLKRKIRSNPSDSHHKLKGRPHGQCCKALIDGSGIPASTRPTAPLSDWPSSSSSFFFLYYSLLNNKLSKLREGGL